MAKEYPPQPEWRGVSGLRIVIPHGRPDVMLVEIKTLYGPVRLSMPKSIALKIGRSIAEEAEKLAPDRSLSSRMERCPCVTLGSPPVSPDCAACSGRGQRRPPQWSESGRRTLARWRPVVSQAQVRPSTTRTASDCQRRALAFPTRDRARSGLSSDTRSGPA